MTPAQTLAVRKRIPAAQSFVLRPSLVGHSLSAGVGLAASLVVLFVLVGYVPPLSDAPVGLIAALLALGAVASVVATMWGGPVLAVNPEGVWLRVRRKSVFLPWSSIEQIYVRRLWFDDRVCVVQRGTVEAEIDRYTTPFTASLTYGNQPEPDVLEAIRKHGAGRTRIDF
ncbi:hypothetical protein DFJ67_3776 [Asanoa ferruginea]|uniref:Uncharacterized protein n=1 Tax=Asanoa ferruginea TaxID=53367 RepID=A0A3D9ZLP5_9ACTN|nr:hypothetical protein [Asanoa ferruginea]REF97769.1 hypothetical protein DFJ67_3776 [Asanoa ferruginea]GIF51961.1 hypothetical protein Afe04nite_65000 [Asanoa ferruginea]